ncbi:MAG: hypothetical protein Ta2G_03520 [Termitinemataceae bacterium]|nr:MAG: hypothetical protein Ta2G_03520 [Termitinemataceae bacterium]
MKKKFICCFIISLIELVIIVVIFFGKIFLSEDKEFSLKIDKTRPHTFSVSSSNLHLYVSMADGKSLQDIFITDNRGREVSFVYSELGIVNYYVVDESCKYNMLSHFADNFVLTENRILVDPDMSEPKSEIVNIRPKSIFREEKYNDGQKKYTIDYTTVPSFFD